MNNLQMTIDENLKGLRETQTQQHSSATSLQPTSRQAQLTEFLLSYSPVRQSELASSPLNCMFGSYPSLTELKATYGRNAPAAWLIPQIKDLSEFCGVRDKITNEQLLGCANVIAAEFAYLKISELMLFFHLMKSGRYGQFYGAVDPMKITTALRSFLVDRNDYFWRLDQRRRERQRDEQRKGAVTYEEYKRMLENGEIA